MARTPGKKQAPAKLEEDDDTEGWEDAVVDAEGKESEADLRMRDWRDVERYREMKELRRLVDDDYGLDEIFHVPLKPRAEPATPGRGGNGKTAPAKVVPVKAAPAKAPPAKAVPAKVVPAKVAKAAPKTARAEARPAPAAKKPAPAKLKAKAKRR